MNPVNERAKPLVVTTTVNTEVQRILATLRAAKTPEEVFGKLAGSTIEQRLGSLSRMFRPMIHLVHPDGKPPELLETCQQAVELLTAFKARAEDRVRADIYGTAKPSPVPKVRAASVQVKTKRGEYTIFEPLATNSTAVLYRCILPGDLPGVFKIARSPACNDMLAHEAAVLKGLTAEMPKGAGERYLPQLVDSFTMPQPGGVQRRVNIFPHAPDYYSASQIARSYYNGVDPRAVGWMANRLLEAMAYTHGTGRVHGCILPPNLLYGVKNHGILLAEWGYSVKVGEPLKAISGRYEHWYPPEVKAKQAFTSAGDIYMAARCVAELLSPGSGLTGTFPKTVPGRLSGFFKACLYPAVKRRPDDARQLREEFGDLLKELFGRATFRKFEMP
jgi:hypothetical protein